MLRYIKETLVSGSGQLLLFLVLEPEINISQSPLTKTTPWHSPWRHSWNKHSTSPKIWLRVKSLNCCWCYAISSTICSLETVFFFFSIVFYPCSTLMYSLEIYCYERKQRNCMSASVFYPALLDFWSSWYSTFCYWTTSLSYSPKTVFLLLFQMKHVLRPGTLVGTFLFWYFSSRQVWLEIWGYVQHPFLQGIAWPLLKF